MSLALRARFVILLPLLGFARNPGGSLPPLDVAPPRIAPSGGALRVRLPDRAALAPSPEAPWVGLFFGRLARLAAVPQESAGALRLCVQVPPLAEIFERAPAPGDELLLAVYDRNRPLARPGVVDVAEEPASAVPECPSNPGDRAP